MNETIVVGTDTGAAAELAVEAAAGLATQREAELVMVYVGSGTRADVVDAAKAADPERYMRDLAAKHRGVPIRWRIEAGDPAETLRRVAQEEGADTIVVGNRGVDERRAWRFLSSVPAGVLRGAPCSVLIVDTSSRR
jgi:nucleotide-binding universal stress UspA family protein